jgi:hypothetical protein
MLLSNLYLIHIKITLAQLIRAGQVELQLDKSTQFKAVSNVNIEYLVNEPRKRKKITLNMFRMDNKYLSTLKLF